MYVNRKKRSVKWVHEGSCQGNCPYVKACSYYFSLYKIFPALTYYYMDNCFFLFTIFFFNFTANRPDDMRLNKLIFFEDDRNIFGK